MLLLDVLTGLPAARSRKSPGSHLPGQGDGGAGGKLKSLAFPRNSGQLALRGLADVEGSFFTALPTIKPSERGDLRVWDEAGGHPHPFWVQYLEIWALLRRWAPGALWHFAEQVPVGAGWRLTLSCTFFFGGGRGGAEGKGFNFVLMLPNLSRGEQRKLGSAKYFPLSTFSVPWFCTHLPFHCIPFQNPGKHPTWE